MFQCDFWDTRFRRVTLGELTEPWLMRFAGELVRMAYLQWLSQANVGKVWKGH